MEMKKGRKGESLNVMYSYTYTVQPVDVSKSHRMRAQRLKHAYILAVGTKKRKFVQYKMAI